MIDFTVSDRDHGNHGEVEAVGILHSEIGGVEITIIDPSGFVVIDRFFDSGNEDPDAGEDVADEQDCHE